MPYIKAKDRIAVTPHSAHPARTIGELTFQIVALVNDYISVLPQDYALYAQVIGALDCAKTEFYRRVVAPYEDQKEHENGDVFPAPTKALDVWED